MARLRIIMEQGFHSATETTIYLNVPNIVASSAHRHSITIRDLMGDYMTPTQRSRLKRHFCGIPGCCCGSWRRATIISAQIKYTGDFAYKEY